MGFDIDKFLATEFKQRTGKVPVPDMGTFFSKDSKPEFEVRGLTGEELARVSEAQDRNKNLAGIVEGILSGDAKEKVEAIRASIGLTDKAPNELVRRIELLVIGSVEPKVTHELAVKIAKTFPIEFFRITNKINELTGKGATWGKSNPSGKTPKQERA